MNFENEFVAHRKIDFFHFATVKMNGSQTNVIYFGSTKNTIVKVTIDKNNSNKIALREIALVECTAFKFL